MTGDFTWALEKLHDGFALRRRAWLPGQALTLPPGGDTLTFRRQHGEPFWLTAKIDVLADDWEIEQ